MHIKMNMLENVLILSWREVNRKSYGCLDYASRIMILV